LKRKPSFSFSQKAKISENSLTFRENENFRESFRKNFLFSRKFFFPGKTETFRERFPPEFRIWIHIQVAPVSGSAFRMENFRENLREAEKFRENFCENENFRNFLEDFREKRKFLFQP
jgi:hypothetical protein